MGLFELMEKHGHEQLIFCYHQPTNLKAIIAVHDTTLGDAVGGCRLWRYKSEEDMINDALKLSKIMTYQSAISDCDTGGGKAVLWHDFEEEPKEAYFRALGRFIEGLNGRFITYPDLGTDTQEMKYIRRETKHVILYQSADKETAESSEITACGVYWGMKACVKEVFGISSLNGLAIAVQGVGSVGKKLVDYLKQEDVKLLVTDLNYDSIKSVQDKHPDVKIVPPDEILKVQCDIFSPCALGPVITKENFDQLKCRIIAGAAYDILEDWSLSQALSQKGIICAPDFVINTGEMFLTEDCLEILSKEKALESTQKIYDIMAKVITKAKKENISLYQAAYLMAVERMKSVGEIKNILTHSK
ncbi:MAG: leucine dehydrogenase [candidate division Zixibacteria bacterium]|nr:leucine dehydrogenase [candidate division Zixibacteria bacterium]